MRLASVVLCGVANAWSGLLAVVLTCVARLLVYALAMFGMGIRPMAAALVLLEALGVRSN